MTRDNHDWTTTWQFEDGSEAQRCSICNDRRVVP